MKKLLVSALFIFISFLVSTAIANAQCLGPVMQCYEVGNGYEACKSTSGCVTGQCEGNTTICCTSSAISVCSPGASVAASQTQATQVNTSKTLPNPLGTVDIKLLIIRIINVVLGLVGALSVVFFIYGGLIWMTAGGSPEKIKKGRDVLTWTILGLVIIFTSYITLNFVFESLDIVTK